MGNRSIVALGRSADDRVIWVATLTAFRARKWFLEFFSLDMYIFVMCRESILGGKLIPVVI